MPGTLFFEIGAIIVLAAVLSFIAYSMRQPLILAYIITGMLAGASMLDLTTNLEMFDALSQIGIAFLLFTVGLGLDWRKMRNVGLVSFIVGLTQIILTSVAIYPVAVLFGFDALTSLFLSLAFSFSSTIIIVKLLADKDDLDTLYGRISLGVLLVQDVVAMFLLLMLGAAQNGSGLAEIFAVSLVKGAVAVLFLAVVSIFILPHIVRYAARSQELLLLFAIGWCFLVAGALTLSGFGIEIGALLAGVSLSGTVFHREILSRVRHLRDFFLIIFFIVLGIGLNPASFSNFLIPSIVFALMIFIIKPIVVIVLLRALGHHPRTGWLSGSSIAQISEFSFIVLSVGVAIGLVRDDAIVVAAAVGIITIAGSAYLIQFNEHIYKILQPILRLIEPHIIRRLRRADKTAEIVLIGHHRIGDAVLPHLLKLKKRLVVIDYDPSVISDLKSRKIPALYGDGGDDDFLSGAQVHDAKLVVSTVPDFSVTTALLKYLKNASHRGVVIVTMRDELDARRAYDIGADYVIVIPALCGERFSEIFDRCKFTKKRWRELKKV
jgi:Kef-type K+ transport system membrane component KefB